VQVLGRHAEVAQLGKPYKRFEKADIHGAPRLMR
jgi:hypothetical protein